MHRELPGVLVRAVEGLRRAMARGHFDIPRVVADATAEYRASSDPIRRFADDVLDVDGDWDHHVLRSGVVAAYRQWAAGPMSEGHQPLGDRAFWSRLVAADDRIDTGVTADNPNGHRYGQDRIVRGIRGWRDDRYDRR
jgi:phage/plasmid-associated DNA primase